MHVEDTITVERHTGHAKIDHGCTRSYVPFQPVWETNKYSRCRQISA